MILDNEFTGDPRVENEVIALREAGHQVFVLCFNYGEKEAFEDFRGAKIVRNKINSLVKNKLKGLNNTLFNFYPLYWQRKILKFAKKYKIEALHVHDLWMLESAVKANKKLNLPIIADLHENFVYAIQHYKYATTFPGNILISQSKWKHYEEKYLKAVDKIIVVIEEARERLIRLGINEVKISVVSNYVNIDEYSKEDEALTESLKAKYKMNITAVYTGGFDIHRGLDIVIKGTSLIKETIKNFKLVLVGGGLIEEDLKKIVDENGLNQYVDFAGYLPHQQLVSYVKMSDICLIPHRKTEHTDNTIPHKLFQYMLMKKPIVASDCKPIKRITEETRCGLIYPFEDHTEFAKRVVNVLNNETEEYGHRGYEAVMSIYNWKAASNELIHLYQSL